MKAFLAGFIVGAEIMLFALIAIKEFTMRPDGSYPFDWLN